MEKEPLRHLTYQTQFCVIGGGLAGLTAAISAARHGTKVLLIQDRPVLGGNSSSEIRMWVRGAHGAENRETGLLSEFELENIYRNPSLNPYLWDSVLYQKAAEEKNLTLLLNTSCVDVQMEGTRIMSVVCWQLTTYSWITVHAELFADCSGDSILAPLTGADYRHGREAQNEYGEEMAPETGDSKTMGMSCLIQARETNHKVKFIAPPFAKCYETDDDFANIAYNEFHSSFRDHTPATDGCNFWWIEVGGEDHSIFDTESLRDELLSISFGVWDHIKNHGDHGADNWELEWVGFLPGKRESRRYLGDHVLTQQDVQAGGRFDDVVAYGGWPLDDHDPAGMRSNNLNAKTKSQMFPCPSPYGIPYRSLYSRNIENLMFAGRNISATHAALSSTRVMATCALMGQAVGTAAAIALKNSLTPREVGEQKIVLLQKQLLEDYCMLPGHRREIPELTRSASVNLSGEEQKILFDGIERMCPPDPHYIAKSSGEKITFSFAGPRKVERLRMVFDLDFSRESVSDSKKAKLFAMKFHQGMDFKPLRMPAHLCREFSVTVSGPDGQSEKIFTTDCNHRDLFVLSVNREICSITVQFGEAWQSDESYLFSCDIDG